MKLEDIYHKNHFKADQNEQQQILDRHTLPTSLLEVYASCTKPPNLNGFTSYREDGKTGLQFYTDPDYFYALWVKEEQEKINERKKNRAVSLCIPRFMQLYPDIVLSASCMSRLLVRDYISSFSFRLLIYTPMLFIARLYVVT